MALGSSILYDSNFNMRTLRRSWPTRPWRAAAGLHGHVSFAGKPGDEVGIFLGGKDEFVANMSHESARHERHRRQHLSVGGFGVTEPQWNMPTPSVAAGVRLSSPCG